MRVIPRSFAFIVLLASALAYGQDQAALNLTPDKTGALSQEQMQQLFRVVAEKDMENDKRLRDYTYIERDEDHKLDGKGQVKSSEAKTYEVMEIYGEQVQRLIEKDDKASRRQERRQRGRDGFRRSSTSARTNPRMRAGSARKKKRKIARKTASLCWK